MNYVEPMLCCVRDCCHYIMMINRMHTKLCLRFGLIHKSCNIFTFFLFLLIWYNTWSDWWWPQRQEKQKQQPHRMWTQILLFSDFIPFESEHLLSQTTTGKTRKYDIGDAAILMMTFVRQKKGKKLITNYLGHIDWNLCIKRSRLLFFSLLISIK